MSYAIMDIEGIGPLMGAKLKKVGIRTASKLLEAAKTAKGRKALAAKLDVDERTVLRWANLVDRMRIKGVGEDYAKLLEAVGVDTVRELKYRNITKLASAMREANKKKRLVRLLPSESRVARWVEQAKTLPAMVSHGQELALGVVGVTARGRFEDSRREDVPPATGARIFRRYEVSLNQAPARSKQHDSRSSVEETRIFGR